MDRIYLSPPNLTGMEMTEIEKAFLSGWVAPMGPSIDELEASLGGLLGGKVLALNSGTSALHLALILAGVKEGDDVIVSSFTFAACANVVLYERAVPIFLDSEEASWNMDPDLLENYLTKAKKMPKAIIVTHLYGIPANIERIISIANNFEIKVIEDAAEALGTTIKGRHVGTYADFGVISFNGNKIITTSAGGALVCDDVNWTRGKHLATQSNSGSLGYDHKEVGYNYRMSNVLAGIGVGQLSKLDQFVNYKRTIYSTYKEELSEYFDFLDEGNECYSNRWLTTALAKNEKVDILELAQYLDVQGIETRRLWKPLHLNEAYADAPFYGTGVCERIFNKGICLPSGTGLTKDQQQYVIEKIVTWMINKQKAC